MSRGKSVTDRLHTVRTQLTHSESPRTELFNTVQQNQTATVVRAKYLELFSPPSSPLMSPFCACFSRRRPDTGDQLYQEQFERIKGVYPGTNYVCLLNSENGDMIAQSEVAAVNADEFTRTIITLKRAALQFAATLNQMESQVVHVKGDDRMFSCYGSEKTILAFYSEMPGVDLELFDCSEADKGIESINMELYRIVHSTHGMRRTK